MDFHAEVLIGTPLKAGRPLVWLGRGDMPRNFVSAADVARLVLLCLADERPRSETLDIGGPENLSNREVVRIYERLLGCRARVWTLPPALGRALLPALRLVHPGIASVLEIALHEASVEQSMDGERAAAVHGVPLTSFSDWVQQEQLRRSLPGAALPAAR